ncbi:MAG: hypothetical protein V4668_03705 [Patescibacteria group bacterium]
MNPNNNEMVSTQHNESKIAQPHPVNQITPVSKYLALALFIILPFLGAYIGYQLAPEKVVEVPVSIMKEEIVAQEGNIQSLRYIDSGDWNEYVNDADNFSKISVINNVLFASGMEDLVSITQSPYFVQLLSSTSDYYIFCIPPFGKGGTCNSLIKYSLTANTVNRLSTSDLHNPYYTNGLVALDGRSIYLVSEDGTEVGRVNFDTDTFESLKKIDLLQPTRFKICGEISCESEIKITEDNELQIKEYEFSACEDVQCINQKEIGTKNTIITI